MSSKMSLKSSTKSEPLSSDWLKYSLKSSTITGSPSVFSMQKGKIPPQAVDLEEVVLGAMMIDKKGVDEVIDILHPDTFYKESHKLIFNSIINLFDKQEPIDIKTKAINLKNFMFILFR